MTARPPLDHHRIPPQLCPHCGYLADACSSMTTDEPPRPRDATMCLACGTFWKFGPTLLPEPFSPEEFAALDGETKIELWKMRRAWARLPPDEIRKMRTRGSKA